MQLKKYFSEKVVKHLLKELYTQVVYPMAVDYVNDSSNQWDNMALQFLDQFVKDALKD